MKCSDCCYWYQWIGEDSPCCHYYRNDGDAPCERMTKMIMEKGSMTNESNWYFEES